MARSAVQELQHIFGPSVDAALDAALARGEIAAPFWGMMRYQFGFVDDNLKPTSAPIGKRFRSSLCLACCEACGGAWREALSVAAGIELLHNFSLIHDDIEDGDPVRRHRPTVWRVWGEPQAINVGDGMFALAVRTLAQDVNDAQMVRQLTEAFLDTCLALTEGQYLDMSFEHRDDVTPEQYLAMIERKTGALIRFSTWAGALVAGADRTTQQRLYDFGASLGAAFQIHDDVLGVWGTPEQTGKARAQDLRNRKKTLPVLVAMKRARPDELRLLEAFFRRENDDVDAVLNLLTDLGIEDQVRAEAASSLDHALQALEAAAISTTGAMLVGNVAREIVGQRSETSAETVKNA